MIGIALTRDHRDSDSAAFKLITIAWAVEALNFVGRPGNQIAKATRSGSLFGLALAKLFLGHPFIFVRCHPSSEPVLSSSLVVIGCLLAPRFYQRAGERKQIQAPS